MTITFPIYLWKCVFYGYFFRPQEFLAPETLPTEGPLPPFPEVLIRGGNEGHFDDQSHDTTHAIDKATSASKGHIESQSHDAINATNAPSLASESNIEDQSHAAIDASDAFNKPSLPSPKVKTPTMPIVGGMWDYMLGVGTTPTK